jgi:DMSO/TMAO reductase YedYZ heme-binding membrane subunit
MTSPTSLTTAAPTAGDADRSAAPKPWPLALRAALGLVAVALCLAVFGLYTVPDFMVMLADQMWSCF